MPERPLLDGHSESPRERAIEAMAAAMRPTLGPEWVKWKGGGGIAALALEALLPVLTEALRGRDFDTAKGPCGCCWDGETLRDCPACVLADTFGGGV